MLGLYLYTHLISHKSCQLLSILNKLTLQKDLQNIVANKVFMDKLWKHNNNETKISNLKTLAGAGNWTRDLLHPKRMRYHCPTESTERISFKKLFNCFDAIGRNVNKQSRICGPDCFNKVIFSVIFLHAWITIFDSFSYSRE